MNVDLLCCCCLHESASGLLKWFSVKSTEAESSTEAGPSNPGPSGTTSASRFETLNQSDCANDISGMSSSLYPETSSSESAEDDFSSSTSNSTLIKRPIPESPNQPKLQFPKQKFGSQQRAFCAKWYAQFPWLHYVQYEDSVLCFYCATAVQRKAVLTGRTDKAFVETGFSNWQKALRKFRKHEQSTHHRFAVDTTIKSSKDVDEMLSSAHAKEKADNRKALYTIVSTIRFLARQKTHEEAVSDHDANLGAFLQRCAESNIRLNPDKV